MNILKWKFQLAGNKVMNFFGYRYSYTIHSKNVTKEGSVIIINQIISHYQEMGWQTEKVLKTVTWYKFLIWDGNYNTKYTEQGLRLITIKSRELLNVCKQLNCNAIFIGKPPYWLTLNEILDIIHFFLYSNVIPNYLKRRRNIGYKFF